MEQDPVHTSVAVQQAIAGATTRSLTEMKEGPHEAPKAPKSFVERHIQFPMNVPAQFDTAYKNVSVNQCSWAAANNCAHALELASLYLAGAHTQFGQLYAQLLAEASVMRKECDKYHCGENVDDPDLVKQFPTLSLAQWRKMETNAQNRAEVLELLQYMENGKEWVQVFYSSLNGAETATRVQLTQDITHVSQSMGRCLLASRIAQSFCLLSLGNGELLICDSHFRAVGRCNIDTAVRYVLADDLVRCPTKEDGYSLTLWCTGQVRTAPS